MNTTTPVQPQAVSTSKRINKTNVEYVQHHLNQAMASLGRVRSQLTDMTFEREGNLAGVLRNADHQVTEAADHIDAAWKDANAVLTELENLFG